MAKDLSGAAARARDQRAVLQAVADGARTQVEAARLLNLSARQVRRKLARLAAGGAAAAGLHGLIGQPSNRGLSAKLRQAVLARCRTRFADFGPTLASEKLAEEGLAVSPDTLRRWLAAEGLWKPQRRRATHRARRPRRDRFGELLQRDASLHDWTEGRGEAMTLHAAIDDATGRILGCFAPAETLEGYFTLFEAWLRRHGRPLALYTDGRTVFHQSGPHAAPTQFGRACKQLGIELIRAHSPQAKGRVERLFGTLQDRWVKEFRLANVRTIAEANAALPRLIADHVRRFARTAASSLDAHRPLHGLELAAILCAHEQRTVANDYVVRIANRHLQIVSAAFPGLRGGLVTLELRRQGELKMRFGERPLTYREIPPPAPAKKRR